MTGEIKSKEIYEKGELLWIETEKIMPNRSQPRTVFDAQALSELAESIKSYGILQPLSVRINPEKTEHSHFQYELIAGERRLRAAKQLGITKVPCVLIESDKKTSAALAIIENLHRKDLNIFEEAAAIAALIEIYDLTQEQIAEKLSLTQAAVANKLRILRLTEEEKDLIIENKLTERHARAVLRLKDPKERGKVLEHICKLCLNVKESEEYIAKLLFEDEISNENIIDITESRDEKEDNKSPDRKISIVATSKEKEKSRKCLIRSIERAINTSRINGIKVKTQQTETDRDLIFTVSIPKS